MLNRVILMGRLTRDPEYKQTASGVSVCRFSIAINRQFANKETGERETDFVDCTAWRGTGEFIARYFAKGNMILVEGELRNNNYTDNNGVKHYAMNVLVNNASFCESKNSSSDGQQESTPAPQQNRSAQNAPAAPPQAAAPADAPLNIGDLCEFEEILSDGDLPF